MKPKQARSLKEQPLLFSVQIRSNKCLQCNCPITNRKSVPAPNFLGTCRMHYRRLFRCCIARAAIPLPRTAPYLTPLHCLAHDGTLCHVTCLSSTLGLFRLVCCQPHSYRYVFRSTHHWGMLLHLSFCTRLLCYFGDFAVHLVHQRNLPYLFLRQVLNLHQTNPFKRHQGQEATQQDLYSSLPC